MEIIKNVMFKRCAAYILDVYFVTITQIILFTLLDYLFFGIVNLMSVILKYKISVLINSILYFFFCEYFFSKTLGKKVFKLKVVYKKSRFSSAVIRIITRMFPLDLFFILINSNQPLHDILAKTDVKEYL
ncbi:RDD family protein [Elizabethkingia anophelis]|nr:RDD family protein [Elizabethkingia anophelis]